LCLALAAWLAFVQGFLASSVSANDVDLHLDFEQSIVMGDDGEDVWRPRAGKVRYVVNKAEKKLSVKFDNPIFKIGEAELNKLKSGWLRVRLPAVNSQGEVVKGKYLVTSIKGCSLLQDPKEVFSLITDKTGALMGLQFDRPLSSDCDSTQTVPQELEVTSKILAALPKEVGSLPLPRIDPETIIQGDGKQKEQQPQTQSFIQQYWYIILPSIILYTLLTAPGGSPEPSTAAAAAAGGAAAAAGAAGATQGGQGEGARRRKQ